MTLSALLVCGDAVSALVLRQVLEELNIRVEACPEVARVAIRMEQQRFDVLILDCKSQTELMQVLQDTRVSRVNDSTLSVVVVQSQEHIRELFSLGVNFVLYKPVAHDRALSSLRAARAVMRKEKRRSPRTAVHAHASADYANVEREQATLIDLSANGMAVQFGKKLPPTSKVYFQFQLPGQSSTVRLSGLLVWQDWNGRAGVQFVDVPKASRKLLTEFLGRNLPKSSRAEAISEVAVEVTESAETAAVSAGVQKHELSQYKKSADAAARLRSESDNRRGETRYACRLGAEVYQTGKSVPYHCSLTDLGPGGCYLEVPSPFAKGASVEITVRTWDLKLRLRGTVQSSHPGYGMGIAFELKTKDERDEVRRLTEFVAATVESSAN